MHYRIIPVTPYQQNCTLFWCEKTRHTAIIDPGGESQKIIDQIDAMELIPESILLTHGHMDHAGGANELAKRLQIPIIGPHREDAFLLDNMDHQAAMFGFGDASACKPDQWLNQGDKVPLGEEFLEVCHCPGHTPGHVIFFHRDARLAQVGDVIFNGSVGRSDIPRGDHNTLIHSIRSQLWPLGDNVRFIPGHGPESTFGQERRTNPFVGDGR